MAENLLFGITLVLLLGISAQWLAWRLHLPSILLLLVFGFLAGPVFKILDVNALMGELLFPVVSVSVALILFEGGLTLRFAEVREVRRAVRNLILVGALITWVISSVGAYWLAGLSLSLSILLGAILVVTGPTVVIPLLRHVRPAPRVGSIAKWEGIIIDPVGATLAVLVFEAILAESTAGATQEALGGFFLTVVVGLFVGGLGAAFIVLLLRFHWIPDYLQNPVTLMTVVAAFWLSDLIQHESGLLAVTVMGVGLANQHKVAVKHIIEFKENLRVLLISSLFILLSARLELEKLDSLHASSFLFVASLIFLARPLSVFLSTLGSQLDWREKVFLSWMAPRGIVAAAVASIFSLELVEEHNFPEAEALVPLTFLIIVTTVALYGLTAKPVARWLGLAQAHPQGFLIMGGHSWAREIALALQKEEVAVLIVDSNWEKIRQSRMAGLRTYYGNGVAEYSKDEIELDGIGRMIALTPNDEANSLACIHYIEDFGRSGVYQLPPKAAEGKEEKASHLQGRLLFSPEATFDFLEECFQAGGVVKTTRISEEFSYQNLIEQHQWVLPMFLLQEDGKVEVFSTDRTLTPKPGNRIMSVVPGSADSKEAEKE